MPIALIYSNLPKERFGGEFRAKFLALLSDSLAKPVAAIALVLNAGADFSYGPKVDEPAVYLNLKSIGRLEPDQNVAHTKAICAFFNQELGLPPARVLIHFENLETHEVGYQGTTVKALMG